MRRRITNQTAKKAGEPRCHSISGYAGENDLRIVTLARIRENTEQLRDPNFS
jgi:hypothetical protein